MLKYQQKCNSGLARRTGESKNNSRPVVLRATAQTRANLPLVLSGTKM